MPPLSRFGRALFTLALLTTAPAQADTEGEPPDAQRLWDQVGQLRDARRAVEALELGRRALALDLKALGPRHAAVGERTADLGVLTRDAGDLTAAEPLFRRAIA